MGQACRLRHLCDDEGVAVSLETERLLLREWRQGDVEELARIYADERVHRFLGGPIDREATERQVARFVRDWEQRGYGHWVAEHRESGRMIGRVGLMHHPDWTASEDKVEVGWTLDPAFWGKGLATEGAQASLRYGFEALGLPRIVSFTLPDNVASRRVMEKCGLTFRGTTPWRGLEHVWYALEAPSIPVMGSDPVRSGTPAAAR